MGLTAIHEEASWPRAVLGGIAIAAGLVYVRYRWQGQFIKGGNTNDITLP